MMLHHLYKAASMRSTVFDDETRLTLWIFVASTKQKTRKALKKSNQNAQRIKRRARNAYKNVRIRNRKFINL